MKNTERTLQKDRRILAVLASGKYTVTRDGRIFNNSHRNTGESRELSYQKDRRGYLYVRLKRINHARVARVIALVFLGIPNEYREPNHKNGIKADNRVSNLEWVTPSQNSIHALETGLSIPSAGEDHYASKLNHEQVTEIRSLISKGDMPSREIAKMYGVEVGTINDIRYGKTWKQVAGVFLPPQKITTKRGVLNARAKLREDDVRKIRERIKVGEPLTQIAKDFGVGWFAVKRIKTGETWGWLK